MDHEEPEYTKLSPKERRNTAGWRMLMLVIGWLLIIASPIIGALPGPGFLILFPIGLAMVLKNSRWAKKQYLKLRDRHPEYGRWTDWALRRKKEGTRPPVPPLKRDILRFFRIRRG
ncbi:PGPGW domain-containing protein [Sphingorhabdus arenilitoris]|uniref:PGPGW domain-containing protein n=1 Tax=Sphingorhabdus arenilitoris TaxID=1490041 RepID=A0ABV8RJJ9_9SPHN